MSAWYSKVSGGAIKFSDANAWNSLANGSGTDGTFNVVEASSSLKSGDTLFLQAGHSLTYDINNSAFTSGFVFLFYGTFTASITAGTYYMKCAGSYVTVAAGGSFLVGTAVAPYPSTCTFTIDLNGSTAFYGTGIIAIYCTEPTHPTVKLSVLATAPASSFTVTDMNGNAVDLSADAVPWTAGQVLKIDGYGAQSSETKAVSSVAAGNVTTSANIAVDKAIGSLIHNVSRNVRIIRGTDIAFFAATNVTFACEIASCNELCYAVTGITMLGGSCYGMSYFFDGSSSVLVTGGILSGGIYPVYMCSNFTMTGGILSGTTYGVTMTPGVTVTGGVLLGNSSALSFCGGINITGGSILGNGYGLRACSGNIANFISTNTSGDLYACCDIKAKNALMGSGTEVAYYNNTIAPAWGWVESRDHDQSVGASKFWSKGGVTVSATASPPTGYTKYYTLTVESATYWGFYQEDYTIAPGQTLKWLVYTNQSVNTTPKVEVVALGNDPLISGSPLAVTNCSTDTGAWRTNQISYTNALTVPLGVQLRVSGKAASGALAFLPVLIQGHESWG